MMPSRLVESAKATVKVLKFDLRAGKPLNIGKTTNKLRFPMTDAAYMRTLIDKLDAIEKDGDTLGLKVNRIEVAVWITAIASVVSAIASVVLILH